MGNHDCCADPEILRECENLALLVTVEGTKLWSGYSLAELSDVQGCVFAPHSDASERACREYKEPAGGVTAEPVTGYDGLRLRARGRHTNALARCGVELPGWWEDLTGTLTPARRALAWLESHLKDSGAKVGVVQLAKCTVTEEEPKPRALPVVQVLFSSEEGDRWLWVAPELLAALNTVRLFRPAAEGLLASLRGKARLWAERRGVPVESLSRVLPGTLCLALLPSPDEVVAVGALRGSAAQWSVDVLGALAKGVARRTHRGGSWWDVLRPSLRFGGTRGSVLGGAGCAPLTLPS